MSSRGRLPTRKPSARLTPTLFPIADSYRLRLAAVLQDCGVVTTATNSNSPVFSDNDIAPGTHINGIGSFRPDMAEVPAETVARAEVVVDHREAALTEAGDVMQPMQRGLLPAEFLPAELGEVLAGTRPGRTGADQVTFFKSVGNAAQDIVCAAEIVAVAGQQNLGRIVEL